MRDERSRYRLCLPDGHEQHGKRLSDAADGCAGLRERLLCAAGACCNGEAIGGGKGFSCYGNASADAGGEAGLGRRSIACAGDELAAGVCFEPGVSDLEISMTGCLGGPGVTVPEAWDFNPQRQRRYFYETCFCFFHIRGSDGYYCFCAACC